MNALIDALALLCWLFLFAAAVTLVFFILLAAPFLVGLVVYQTIRRRIAP